MPRKPSLDVNRREVREEIRRTGGNQVDVDRASTASGRKAKRIAAKLQGVSREVKRDKGRDQKMTKPSGKKVRKQSRAA
jgi:hypothetical protein